MTTAEEKITEATKKLYSRLTDSLKDRTPSTNGWTALMDMEYHQYLEAKSLEKFEEEFDTTHLHPHNTVGGTVNCICGKSHIVRINVMTFPNYGQDWRYLLLGSECIDTTKEFLQDLEGVEQLYDKLKIWSDITKEEKKKYSHNKCIACDNYGVKKDYNYKNEARKLWCKNCCYGGRVKCTNCDIMRVFMNDYKGKPMRLCYSCYKSSH